jgi:DNA-binding response OmpR family regulator
MKILVIDDSDRMSNALTQALSDRRYTVNIAPDGKTGYELANSLDYQLIVVARSLPHLDGVSLCQQLREQGHQTPILMLTSKSEGSDRAIGDESGANEYLVEPFDMSDILERVRELTESKPTQSTSS